MKQLKIPKHLEEAFKNFLDVAQFGMPELEDPYFSEDERDVLKLVRKYLGKNLSTKR